MKNILFLFLFQSAFAYSQSSQVWYNHYLVQGEKFYANVRVDGMTKTQKLQLSGMGGLLPPGGLRDTAGSSKVSFTVDGNEGSILLPQQELGVYKYLLKIKVVDKGKVIHQETKELLYEIDPLHVIYNMAEHSVVYEDWENEISLAIQGVSANRITLYAGPEVDIKARGDGKYLLSVNPRTESESIIIKTAIKSGQGTMVAASDTFQVKKLPSPRASIEKKHRIDGKIPQYEIKIEELVLYKNTSVKILSWQLNIYHQNRWHSFTGNGSALPPEALDILEKREKGDKVLLENVQLLLNEKTQLVAIPFVAGKE